MTSTNISEDTKSPCLNLILLLGKPCSLIEFDKDFSCRNTNRDNSHKMQREPYVVKSLFK